MNNTQQELKYVKILLILLLASNIFRDLVSFYKEDRTKTTSIEITKVVTEELLRQIQAHPERFNKKPADH